MGWFVSSKKEKKRKKKKKQQVFGFVGIGSNEWRGCPFFAIQVCNLSKKIKEKKSSTFFFFYCRIVVVRGGFDLAGVLEIHKKKKIKLKPKTCKIWFLEEKKRCMATVDANPLKAPIVSSTSCLNFECGDNQLWTRLDRFIGSFVNFFFLSKW